MYAALCDDDKIVTSELKDLLFDYAKSNQISLTIDCFSSGERLLEAPQLYDVIVLDYQLGSTNGLAVAKELRRRSVLSSIIFLTNYPQFMIDAFEVNTFRFLLKPVDKEKLFRAIDDYLRISNSNYPITVIHNKQRIKIESDKISFIEANGKYTEIHTNGEVVRCSKTLSRVEKLLPGYCFVRTHRAYVVNLHYVERYTSDTVYLTNGETAYLSRTYCKSFKTSLMTFLERNYVRL